jgi:hypothetical protein
MSNNEIYIAYICLNLKHPKIPALPYHLKFKIRQFIFC